MNTPKPPEKQTTYAGWKNLADALTTIALQSSGKQFAAGFASGILGVVLEMPTLFVPEEIRLWVQIPLGLPIAVGAILIVAAAVQLFLRKSDD